MSQDSRLDSREEIETRKILTATQELGNEPYMFELCFVEVLENLKYELIGKDHDGCLVPYHSVMG